MSALVPILNSATLSKFSTVTATSAVIGLVLAAGQLYVFNASTDCYVMQGATPTAAASNGSWFVKAGSPMVVDGNQGAGLAVVRLAADGVCTLARATFLR